MRVWCTMMVTSSVSTTVWVWITAGGALRTSTTAMVRFKWTMMVASATTATVCIGIPAGVFALRRTPTTAALRIVCSLMVTSASTTVM